MVARFLGRYAVYDEIAAGGMATVHFGRLFGTGGFARTVAIKTLHPQFAKDPEFSEMFMDEARVVARIRHPNVVPTLDVVAEDSELFMVMEYVHGEPLSRLVRRVAPPLRVAIAIVCNVLHGLHAAHEATDARGELLGVVHRDVSPQNILVGADGVARVLDFGVAKAQDRIQITREGMLKGKVAYMSPEQSTGAPVDRRTDVYAAGVVLWEALAGTRLFAGGNNEATADKVRAGVIAPPSIYAPAVTKEMDAIVLRATAKDPEQRYATAHEMAIDLERFDVATSSEIAAWVEEAAGSVLRARSEQLRSIERQARPERAERAPSANVREPSTAFLGRKQELVALAETFSHARMVTLMGPGGCGKTRLAKRHAVLHAADYAGGVWFVPLSEARTSNDVIAAVARAFGMSLTGGRGDDDTAAAEVGHALGARGPTLLVLDNCEQVVAHVERLVTQWLDVVPSAHFLATSRERLGVVGEHVHELLPLGLPREGEAVGSSEAVQLFVDRARLVRHDYVLTDVEAPVVAQIVRALDGIPLAIELAAARTAIMATTTLLERLGSRFQLLRVSPSRETRGAAHHRTLLAAIDWSWDLLEPWEQATLAQCSIFSGGFALEAAEAIVSLQGFPSAPPVLDILQRLRDKSLIFAQPSRDSPDLRLGLYESIREYAALKLGEATEETRRRHAAYFLERGADWAERATRGSAEHVRLLTLEAENLRALHAHALGRDPHAALRAADILHTLLWGRAPSSVVLDVANRTIASARVETEPLLLANVLFNRSFVWRRLGAPEKSRADAERLLELAKQTGSAVCEVQARISLVHADASGSFEAREAHCLAAVEAARAAGERRWQRRALLALGSTQENAGRLESARETCLEIVRLAEADDDLEIVARVRCNLGVILLELGKPDEAQRAFEGAIAVHEAIGSVHGRNADLHNLATARYEQGDHEGAERAYREVIEKETDDGWVRCVALAALGALLATRDDVEQAAKLLDMADAASQALLTRTVAATHRGQLDLARARLAARAGDGKAAEEHRASAMQRWTAAASNAHLADDVRTARRWLERTLSSGQ